MNLYAYCVALVLGVGVFAYAEANETMPESRKFVFSGQRELHVTKFGKASMRESVEVARRSKIIREAELILEEMSYTHNGLTTQAASELILDALHQLDSPPDKFTYHLKTNVTSISSVWIRGTHEFVQIEVDGDDRVAVTELVAQLAAVWEPLVAILPQPRSEIPHSAIPTPVFTQTLNIGPVRTDYNRIFPLIAAIRDAAQLHNGQQSNSESLKLGTGNIEFSITGGFLLADLSGAPKVVHNLSYRYGSVFETPTRPISEVTLVLHDRTREITVTGNDQLAVTALIAVLESKARGIQTSVGGSSQRMVAGACILFLGPFIGYFSSKVSSTILRILCVVIGILLPTSLWILPWQQWFPGTAIFSAYASFYDRHASMLTFWGFVITVVAVVSAIKFPFLKASPSEPAKVAPEATESVDEAGSNPESP